MLRPEEHDVDGGSEPEPSNSSSAAGGGVDGGGGGDDRRGEKAGVASATGSGSEDRALPTPDDRGLGSHAATTSAEPPRPSSHHGGVVDARGSSSIGVSRAYQFRKAKSAATFLLDGVSYTIGEYRSTKFRPLRLLSPPLFFRPGNGSPSGALRMLFLFSVLLLVG